MGVVSFVSLKGGVGKTSLSVNVARAFRQRGCRVVVIDLDPTGHCSRLFARSSPYSDDWDFSSLPRTFLALDKEHSSQSAVTQSAVAQSTGEVSPSLSNSRNSTGGSGEIFATAAKLGTNLLYSLSAPKAGHRGADTSDSSDDSSTGSLSLIPGGDDLRLFQWGSGSRAFSKLFGELIRELESHFDHIVVDTPPDLNVLTRVPFAHSDLVVVPVDSSVMSIDCLEEVIAKFDHIEKPTRAIVRTMVDRRATRVAKRRNQWLSEAVGGTSPRAANSDSFESDLSGAPIYLLDSIVPRSESHNALTYDGATAFDSRSTKVLAQAYLGVASELELLMSMDEDYSEDVEMIALESFGC